MKNFNEDELLDFLKDFQLKTVNYVYDKLYSENGSNKFLIADES